MLIAIAFVPHQKVIEILPSIKKSNTVFVLDPDRGNFYPHCTVIRDHMHMLVAIEEWCRSNPDENVKMLSNPAFVATMNGAVSHSKSLLIMAERYDPKWVTNTLKNIESKRINDVDKVKIDNKNFMIIAPGVSLEKDFEDVLELKKNYTTIALSRSCQLTNRYDWDFIIVIDHKQNMLQHFNSQRNFPNTGALFSYSVEPAMLGLHFREIYGLACHWIFDTWIRGVLGRHIPLFFGSSTVLHMAVEFALFMKAEKIVMVGSDLALTNGRRYAFRDDKAEGQIDVWSVEKGVKVKTQHDLLSTATTITAFAYANQRTCEFFNTAAGMFLEGWRHRPLKTIK